MLTMDNRFAPDMRAYFPWAVHVETSFNEADEPIVCSPADTVVTFARCGLDALVIGSFVVTRRA